MQDAFAVPAYLCCEFFSCSLVQVQTYDATAIDRSIDLPKKPTDLGKLNNKVLAPGQALAT
jgi:hypothetical protein